MEWFRQVRLLLWKNWLVQRRQFIWTTFELLLPIVLSLILAIVRQEVATNRKAVTTYEPFLVSGNIEDLARPVDGRPIANWCFRPTVLFYTPDTAFTRAIMHGLRGRYPHPNQTVTRVNETYAYFEEKFLFEIVGFPTEEALLREIKKGFESAPPCHNKYLGAIVFQDGFVDFDLNSTRLEWLKELRYKIRLGNSARNTIVSFSNDGGLIDQGWYTNMLYPIMEKLGPRQELSASGGSPGYWIEGFLTLQRAVDISIIQLFAFSQGYDFSFVDQLSSPISLRRFPYPAYVDNPFVMVMQRQFPMILTLSFALSVLYIVRNIVKEKENRLKEYLRVMGVSNFIQWVAHFIINYTKLLIGSAAITALLTVPFRGLRIIDRVDPLVLFAFLAVYSAAIVCYCFAVSVFFKAGNTAAACGGIIWFIIYLPYYFLQPRYATLSKATKILSSLSLNTAMAFGSQIVGAYEGLDVGLQWYNIGRPAGVGDNLSMLDIVLMLLVDIVICLLITWYVEAIFPGDEGVPQPWYFPFMRSYWCGSRRASKPVLNGEATESYGTISGAHVKRDARCDSESTNGAPQVILKSLTKIYNKGKGKKLAVDNLDLTMNFGQLTVLLGHNGAGKSTTMSMMTGIIAPTSGAVIIKGFDISVDLARARKYVGLCPQHNVLFDNLTVYEHLEFFCRVKGRKLNASEANYLLSTLGLEPKRKDYAKNLSGGMKRKLCLIIALIGGSEVVMLDEPTSGMDPDARHDAWHLLQQEKRRRTILFTTHYMEEADLLGDRIAILARGRLQCFGSSMSLKRTYGAGYNMVAIFKHKDPTVVRNVSETMLRMIQSFVPDARLQSSIGAEAVFILPTERRSQFANMFAELEREQSRYGINSLGLSVTTMEEVFLRVCEKADTEFFESTEMGGIADAGLEDDSDAPLKLGQRNEGLKLFSQHFRAMITKHFIHWLRNWLVLFVQLIVPVIIITLTLLINDTLPGPVELPELPLTSDTYGYTSVGVHTDFNERDDFLQDVANSYVAQLRNHDVQRLADGDMTNFVIDSVDRISQAKFDIRNIFAATFASSTRSRSVGTPLNITAYFNGQTYHGPAVTINAMDNALLRSALFNRTGLKIQTHPELRITTVNHPLPPTKADDLHSWAAVGVVEFNIAFNLVFAMSFLSSSFMVFLVKERTNKAKHLQLLGGVHPTIFWLAALIWDFFNYTLTVVLVMMVFVCFDVQPLIGAKDDHWLHVLILFWLYGWASLPLTYVASFLVESPGGGFVKLTIFNIFSGLFVIILIGILKYPLHLLSLADKINWIGMALFPGYGFGQGLLSYYSNVFRADACEPFLAFCDTMDVCCEGREFTHDFLRWDPPGIGQFLFCLTLSGFIYFLLLAFVEFGYVRRCRRFLRSCFRRRFKNLGRPWRRNSANIFELEENSGKGTTQRLDRIDDDVAAENLRVTNWRWKTDASDSVLIAETLEKQYGNFVAVNKLSFAVTRGECFGLLGVNGAGKTSTFQMLTGENDIDNGDAFINGISICNDWRKAGPLIGYCPQFSAVIDQMTAAEMLTMFARIRGIREQLIGAVVSQALNSIGISEYADKEIATYSGGTKRKLSLAIGLIGIPAVLMLDEPTSGVDPASRRIIWRVLSQVKENGVAVLLTSHSMDECEALCGRLAIMVGGRFKCIGSPQHLKAKFGNGYTLLVRANDERRLCQLAVVLEEKFPGTILKEIHGHQATFRVPVGKNNLSSLFRAMEELVPAHGIADYSFSQTNLEEIFLSFAKQSQSVKMDSRGLENQFGAFSNHLADSSDEFDLV